MVDWRRPTARNALCWRIVAETASSLRSTVRFSFGPWGVVYDLLHVLGTDAEGRPQKDRQYLLLNQGGSIRLPGREPISHAEVLARGTRAVVAEACAIQGSQARRLETTPERRQWRIIAAMLEDQMWSNDHVWDVWVHLRDEAGPFRDLRVEWGTDWFSAETWIMSRDGIPLVAFNRGMAYLTDGSSKDLFRGIDTSEEQELASELLAHASEAADR